MRVPGAIVLVALLAAGCARSEAGSPSEMTVIPLGGAVTVFEDGESTALEEATEVDAGARVATAGDGRAEVLLGDQGSLELAPEAEVALPAVDGSQVLSGSVLVRAPEQGMVVDAGADLEANESVFRVDRGFSVILAVYRGEVDVLGSGVAPVSALRQTTILPGGEIQTGHGPLQVRPNDPWDIDILGPAIDLGQKLVTLERGLTRQIPSNGAPRTIAAAMQRDLPRSLVTEALRSLDAARATIAAVLADQAARLNDASPDEALSEIVDLHGAGAHWIVVVARWGLAAVQADLLTQLARMTSTIARAVAPAPSSAGLFSSGDTAGGSPGGGGSTTTTSGGPTDGGDSDKNGGGPKPEPPDDPPAEDGDGGGGGTDDATCENQVDCVIGGILGGSTPG